MRLAFAICAFSSFALAQGPPSLFGFLPNSGQFPPAVRFVRYASNNFVYLTSDSFVLQNLVRIQIAGIAANIQPVGVSPMATIFNFYEGNNSSQWSTNTQMFGGVQLNNVYPGVTATFTTSLNSIAPAPGFGQGEIIFSIAAGADPSPIQINVLNTGASPMQGPGAGLNSVYFAGGRIPGVFAVGAQATQPTGGASTAVTCNLIINASGSLSIQLPNRNPSLETDVAITFPDYGLATTGATPGFAASTLQYPSTFGQDGAIPNASCGTNGTNCMKAVIAKIDTTGNPIWVTVFGGSGSDSAFGEITSQSGVVVSGETSSSDFPVTNGAPHSSPGSSNDVFLAYFDGASGQLRSSTYAGLQGTAYVGQQLADSAGDAAVSGGYSITSGGAGFILLWQPQQNQFVYTRMIAAPVSSIAFDATSNLYFTATEVADAGIADTGYVIDAGELDSTGNLMGSIASIDLPPATQPGGIQLQPAGANGFWLLYPVIPTGAEGRGSLWAARILPALGQIAVNSRVADQGAVVNTGLTPLANLKLLVQAAAPDEATSPNAQLVAACPNTSYFMVLSPTAQLVYATYVPTTGFDFADQNESTGTPPAAITCFASTAGRSPSTQAAPGELITITGAGFGPLSPIYTAPGADGMYPLAAQGFNVTIGGLNAPIIAVARGLIAVQVPFEIASVAALGQPLAVEVFQGSQTFPSIPVQIAPSVLTLFDTGDRNNSLNLPALAAVNQDGTVNSADNPAAAGSIISVFASGLGILSPPLQTGGVNPIPPAGPLSLTSLFNGCVGCSGILYLGSAPALSTGVAQVNLQIPVDTPGSGVRPQAIGVGVSESLMGLFVAEPTGVVFIR
jgi:uncharacterized protein (TIGR03437 family)